MLTERRNTRSANPWTALNHLLEARASVQALAQERLAQAGIRQPTQRLRMEAPVAPEPAMETPPVS